MWGNFLIKENVLVRFLAIGEPKFVAGFFDQRKKSEHEYFFFRIFLVTTRKIVLFYGFWIKLLFLLEKCTTKTFTLIDKLLRTIVQLKGWSTVQ